MRHAMLARKGFRQRAGIFKEHCWCLPGKFPKIANEMGLVVIAAVNSDGGPTLVISFDCTEDLLEAQDPAEQLRSYADVHQKSSLQLPTTDAGLARQLLDRNLSAALQNPRHQTSEPRVVLRKAHALDQQRFYRSDL